MILKVKSLIEQDNKIGKVLSSSVVAAGGTRRRDGIIEGLKYFTRRVVGGNIVTIGFGQCVFSESILPLLVCFMSMKTCLCDFWLFRQDASINIRCALK